MQERLSSVARVSRFGALLCAFALAACGSDEQAAAPVPQVRKPDVVVAPADPTAKMARAVTIGKSNVPVELKYEIAAKPMIGQPIEIELAFVPKQSADSLSMSFAPSAGLTLSADSSPNLDAVKTGQAHHVKLSAMADKPEVFYITVTATLYTAGTSSPRTFAIPLIVSSQTEQTDDKADDKAAAPAEAKKI